MDTAAAEALANALMEARRSRRPVAAATADSLAAAAGVAGALLAQRRTVESLGAVRAWKCSPPDADGFAPFAPILEPTMRITGTPAPRGLFIRMVELEIAFRIDSELPDAAAPDFEDTVRRAVTAIPVIELIDSRMEDFASRSALAKLADLQVNGGLVVGAPAGTPDVSRPVVRLAIDGTAVVDGPTPAPGGDAFATLVHFLRIVGTHCGGVQRGHIVTTGALGGPHPAPAGARVSGTIENLGAVAMSFG